MSKEWLFFTNREWEGEFFCSLVLVPQTAAIFGKPVPKLLLNFCVSPRDMSSLFLFSWTSEAGISFIKTAFNCCKEIFKAYCLCFQLLSLRSLCHFLCSVSNSLLKWKDNFWMPRYSTYWWFLVPGWVFLIGDPGAEAAQLTSTSALERGRRGQKECTLQQKCTVQRKEMHGFNPCNSFSLLQSSFSLALLCVRVA